jgi:hypothetical protein
MKAYVPMVRGPWISEAIIAGWGYRSILVRTGVTSYEYESFFDVCFPGYLGESVGARLLWGDE